MPDSQKGGGGGDVDLGPMGVVVVCVEDTMLVTGMSPSGGFRNF